MEMKKPKKQPNSYLLNRIASIYNDKFFGNDTYITTTNTLIT